MALTKVTSDVINIVEMTTKLRDELTPNGIKSYIDEQDALLATVSDPNFNTVNNTVSVPDRLAGDNSAKAANTRYVDAAVAASLSNIARTESTYGVSTRVGGPRILVAASAPDGSNGDIWLQPSVYSAGVLNVVVNSLVSFIVPAGVTSINYTIVGGGGGGGVNRGDGGPIGPYYAQSGEASYITGVASAAGGGAGGSNNVGAGSYSCIGGAFPGGGGGGYPGISPYGGAGTTVTGTMSVTPGQVLTMKAGRGGNGGQVGSQYGAGGTNGNPGANSPTYGYYTVGAGGGAGLVRLTW